MWSVLACARPTLGCTMPNLGCARPTLDCAQVGQAQPKFGMVQLKVGMAQWHGLCHLRLVMVDPIPPMNVKAIGPMVAAYI